RGTGAEGLRPGGGGALAATGVGVRAAFSASPAFWSRSAFAPAAHLRELGIAVTADLPGAGDNLIDHPLAAVDLPTTPGYAGPRFQMMLTARSSLAAPDGPPDLHLFAAGPFDDPASPAGGVVGLVTGLLSVRS